MITIMQLINTYSFGGAEKLVFDLATRLDKGKFNVLICSIVKREGKAAAQLCKDLESCGVRVLSLNKPPNKKRLNAIIRLCKYLRENHINILHTHCSSPDFYGKLAAIMSPTQTVFSTIHTIKGGNDFYQSLLNYSTTKYIAISKTVERYAICELRIPSEKIEVIYNAVDINKFKSLSTDKKSKLRELAIVNAKKIVTNIGNIREAKGQIYLIEAARLVLNEFADTHFIIVGDDLLEPELACHLKKEVEIAGMQDKISFIGMRSDIPEILSITDLFVLPSLREGLPLALLEAMATGIPVIATSVGSNPEIVTDGINGFLVPPKDSDALAQKINEALLNMERAKRLGREGQNTVERSFTVEQMVNKYEQLYLNFNRINH